MCTQVVGNNYDKFHKQVFTSLRDRLQHNEDLKTSSSDKPSPITKTLYGYSSSQRLKVINAFNSIRKNFRAAKARADAAANQRSQKNNQVFQMSTTLKKSMFPDQRNILLNNSSGNTDSSVPPLLPPPALPTFSGSFPVPESHQQRQQEQTSTSIPLTPASPTTKPPQQQTLTDFFDSPAFKLLQKTRPGTVDQILGNHSIQNNAFNAASTSNETDVDGSLQETTSTASTPHLVENSDRTPQNDTSTQQQQHSQQQQQFPQPQQPVAPETQTVETRQVEKPTGKYIPSVRTTQQNLFVKSALGALSCLHNLSDETLREERMQRERDEAISKAQRPSYRQRSRDYRDDDDRDRSSRSDRERRRKRSRSRSRDRNRDRSRDRRRPHDRSRDRSDRDTDRSRGRSRERDRSRDRSDREKQQPVGEEIPLYAKKDYANIWRKKMEEVEHNFSKKYTYETSNNEESQSEGPLVIDTGL